MKNDTFSWKDRAEVLKGIGESTRLNMIALMKEQDMCVCEFVSLFNMSQPAVSQHVRRLKNIGLVTEKRSGQWVFYRLNTESEAYSFIEPLLAQLPDVQEQIQHLEQKGLRVMCGPSSDGNG
jgi:ArsR family transcriptional regulator, arsenate/arsenite/antimonite-responsive transcriptional repressor